MKRKLLLLSKALLLVAAVFTTQAFSNFGGDYYSLSLNDKLLVEQFLARPKELAPVDLHGANAADRLVVRFSHCGTAGKSRVLQLRDASGKTLHRWTFPDSPSTGMQLAVGEILKEERAGSSSLYYASKELPAGKFLATFRFGGATAKK